MHTITGSTVAAKRDEKGAKLRLSLVNHEFIKEVAKVREFGISKHGLDSYKLYPNKMYIDAIYTSRERNSKVAYILVSCLNKLYVHHRERQMA